MIFIYSPLSTSNRKKFKFYKVHYNLSNFHKILSAQNAMDTPNETEETTTAINGKQSPKSPPVASALINLF